MDQILVNGTKYVIKILLSMMILKDGQCLACHDLFGNRPGDNRNTRPSPFDGNRNTRSARSGGNRNTRSARMIGEEWPAVDGYASGNRGIYHKDVKRQCVSWASVEVWLYVYWSCFCLTQLNLLVA